MSRKLSVTVRLVLGLSILAVILYHTHLNENLLTVLLNSKSEYILGGFLVFFLHYLSIYLRWAFLLNKVGRFSFSHVELLRSLLGGNALGLVTPGRIGELARGVFFHKDNFWKISGLSIIDKGYAHIISIILGIAGLWFIGIDKLNLSNQNVVLINIVIIALLLISIFLIAMPRLFSLAVDLVAKIIPSRWRKYISPLSENLRHLTKKESLIIAIISLLINLTSFLEFYIILHAFASPDLIPTFWAFQAAYLTVNFLPFSFSDLGIREGVRIFFLGLVGLTAAPVLNTSLIMFFFNAIMPAALGLLAIPKIKAFVPGR